MFTSSNPDSFATRSLSVLRSVGDWVAISPEQTYVATSIRGLGTCKSTYCHAERRELPEIVARNGFGRRVAPLLAALVAAVGLLSACATYRPLVDMNDVTDRGQYEHDLADCQNFAAPVSPGVSAGAGAVFGADLGAAVADRDLALQTARLGAVEGAVAGGMAGADDQVQIPRSCMDGRGYFVLN